MVLLLYPPLVQAARSHPTSSRFLGAIRHAIRERSEHLVYRVAQRTRRGAPSE
jgi:hypothetical protein